MPLPAGYTLDLPDEAQSYATPGPYQTSLSPDDEASFQQWVKQAKPPSSTRRKRADPTFSEPDNDYDMRGYWKAMQGGDPNAIQSKNLHFPDKWKTPYHDSFSNESMYATPDAPHWINDHQLADKGGRVVFDERPALAALKKEAAQRKPRVIIAPPGYTLDSDSDFPSTGYISPASKPSATWPGETTPKPSLMTEDSEHARQMKQAKPIADSAAFALKTGRGVLKQLGADPADIYAKGQHFVEHPVDTFVEALKNPPIRAGAQMIGGMVKHGREEVGQAYDAAREGNLAAAASHAISAIPVLGPALDEAVGAAQARGMNAPGNSYWQNLKIAATTPETLGAVIGTAAQAAPLAAGRYAALKDAYAARHPVISPEAEYLPPEETPVIAAPQEPPTIDAEIIRPEGLPVPRGPQEPPAVEGQVPGGTPPPAPPQPGAPEGLSEAEQAVHQAIDNRVALRIQSEAEVRRDLMEIAPENRQAVLEAIHQQGMEAYANGDIATAAEAVQKERILRQIVQEGQVAASAPDVPDHLRDSVRGISETMTRQQMLEELGVRPKTGDPRSRAATTRLAKLVAAQRASRAVAPAPEAASPSPENTFTQDAAPAVAPESAVVSQGTSAPEASQPTDQIQIALEGMPTPEQIEAENQRVREQNEAKHIAAGLGPFPETPATVSDAQPGFVAQTARRIGRSKKAQQVEEAGQGTLPFGQPEQAAPLATQAPAGLSAKPKAEVEFDDNERSFGATAPEGYADPNGKDSFVGNYGKGRDFQTKALAKRAIAKWEASLVAVAQPSQQQGQPTGQAPAAAAIERKMRRRGLAVPYTFLGAERLYRSAEPHYEGGGPADVWTVHTDAGDMDVYVHPEQGEEGAINEAAKLLGQNLSFGVSPEKLFNYGTYKQTPEIKQREDEFRSEHARIKGQQAGAIKGEAAPEPAAEPVAPSQTPASEPYVHVNVLTGERGATKTITKDDADRANAAIRESQLPYRWLPESLVNGIEEAPEPSPAPAAPRPPSPLPTRQRDNVVQREILPGGKRWYAKSVKTYDELVRAQQELSAIDENGDPNNSRGEVEQRVAALEKQYADLIAADPNVGEVRLDENGDPTLYLNRTAIGALQNVLFPGEDAGALRGKDWTTEEARDDLNKLKAALPQNKNEQKVWPAIIRLMETAISKSGSGGIALVGKMRLGTHAAIDTLREELLHRWQRRRSADGMTSSHLTPEMYSALFDTLPEFSREWLRDNAYVMGNELYVIEAAAKIMANKYARMGFTEDQALDWLEQYFEAVTKQHGGPEAVTEIEHTAGVARDLQKDWERRYGSAGQSGTAAPAASAAAPAQPDAGRTVPSVEVGGPGSIAAGAAQGEAGRVDIERPAVKAGSAITETPEFRYWFRNSRVVDEDGNPLVVYHGSHRDFTEFKRTRGAHFGFHFGDQEAANTRLEDTADKRLDTEGMNRQRNVSEEKYKAWSRYDEELRSRNREVPDEELLAALKADDAGDTNAVNAIFDKYAYKPTPEESAKLALLREEYERSRQPIQPFGIGSNIGGYYLSAQRLLKMPDVGAWSSVRKIKEALPFDSDARTLGELEDDIKSHGYDGIVYPNRVENPVMHSNSYIVFDPEQIKSVNNRGTFDPAKRNTLMDMERPPLEPTEVPAAQRRPIKTFVSSNVFNLDNPEDAQRRLGSMSHKWFRQESAWFLNELGSAVKPRSATGIWTDGAEDSLVHEFPPDVDPDLVTYHNAVMAKAGWQKFLLNFFPQEDGKDVFYRLNLPKSSGSPTNIARVLDKYGIQASTIVNEYGGHAAFIATTGEDEGTIKEAVQNAAEELGGKDGGGVELRRVRGRSEYVGDDDRGRAQEVFARIIDDKENIHPEWREARLRLESRPDFNELWRIGEQHVRLLESGRIKDPFTRASHGSPKPNIVNVDPSYHGKGPQAGEESKRKRAWPDYWVNRSYFQLEGTPGERPYINFPHQYQARFNRENLYDYMGDPRHLFEQVPEDVARYGDGARTYFERLIKDAGYDGYYISYGQQRGVIAAFTNTPVEAKLKAGEIKLQPPEPQGGAAEPPPEEEVPPQRMDMESSAPEWTPPDKPYSEWSRIDKNRDWAERNKLPVDSENRVRLYHATPISNADSIAREGLREGSFLTDDKETALQQAGRERGLMPDKLAVFEAWIPCGSFYGTTWAQTARSLTPDEVSLKPVEMAEEERPPQRADMERPAQPDWTRKAFDERTEGPKLFTDRAGLPKGRFVRPDNRMEEMMDRALRGEEEPAPQTEKNKAIPVSGPFGSQEKVSFERAAAMLNTMLPPKAAKEGVRILTANMLSHKTKSITLGELDRIGRRALSGEGPRKQRYVGKKISYSQAKDVLRDMLPRETWKQAITLLYDRTRQANDYIYPADVEQIGQQVLRDTPDADPFYRLQRIKESQGVGTGEEETPPQRMDMERQDEQAGSGALPLDVLKREAARRNPAREKMLANLRDGLSQFDPNTHMGDENSAALVTSDGKVALGDWHHKLAAKLGYRGKRSFSWERPFFDDGGVRVRGRGGEIDVEFGDDDARTFQRVRDVIDALPGDAFVLTYQPPTGAARFEIGDRKGVLSNLEKWEASKSRPAPAFGSVGYWRDKYDEDEVRPSRFDMERAPASVQGTQVADESGKPLVVFHGTNKDISEMTSFDPEMAKSEGGAFFFSHTPTSGNRALNANTYAQKGAVIPAYLKVNKLYESGLPLPIPHDDAPQEAFDEWVDKVDKFNRSIDWDKNEYMEREIRKAKQKGYDGIVFRNIEDDRFDSGDQVATDVYAVFSPNQIKFALAERGEEQPPQRMDMEASNEARNKVFDAIADQQRYHHDGDAEDSMLKAQFYTGGGVWADAIEHVGDLLHRMTENTSRRDGLYPEGSDFGYGNVKDKVDRKLWQLRRDASYIPFTEEHETNLRNNYEYYREQGKFPPDFTFDDFKNRTAELGEKYAQEHANLPVYNRMQWLARQAAIDLGRMNFRGAETALGALRDHLDQGREHWREVAGQYDPNFERPSRMDKEKKAKSGPISIQEAQAMAEELRPKGSTVPIMTAALTPRYKVIGDTDETGQMSTIAGHLESVTRQSLRPLLPKDDTRRRNAMVNRAVKIAKDELQYQLAQENSGANWYKTDIDDMLDWMRKLHPELKNPTKNRIFRAIAATTSPGHSAAFDNIDIAEQAYGLYKKTGKIPLTQPDGTPWGTYGNSPLVTLQAVLDHFDGDESKAMRWLLTEHSRSELEEAKASAGFSKSTVKAALPPDADENKLYGAYIFGPKVGPFFLNLNGISTQLTVDRWFMRTWNRWMGTLVGIDGQIQDVPRGKAERAAMLEAISELEKEFGLETSQVQAALWYYEQGLYARLGQRGKFGGTYANAAKEVYDLRSSGHGGRGKAYGSGWDDAFSTGAGGGARPHSGKIRGKDTEGEGAGSTGELFGDTSFDPEQFGPPAGRIAIP